MVDIGPLQTSLYNVATGTTTPISHLIPPALLQEWNNASFTGFAGIVGMGIDDRGDILAQVSGMNPNGSVEDDVPPVVGGGGDPAGIRGYPEAAG